MTDFYKLNYNEFNDVPYSVGEKQKFDLFVAKTDKKEIPMMIFIHGGGWKSGSKNDYTEEMKRICEKYPICCLSVGYRFISEEMSVTYKEIQSDIANAIHTAVKYVEGLGKTVTNKGIGGISAGAYNSMMYAFERNKKNPGSFAFVFDKSGPCDLSDVECYKGTNELPEDMAYRIYGQLLGFEFDKKTLNMPDIQNKLQEASPYYLLDESSPPVLISHSKKDEVVPYSCAKKLYEKLIGIGIKTDFVDMNGCGHSQTIEEIEKKINVVFDNYIEKYLIE